MLPLSCKSALAPLDSCLLFLPSLTSSTLHASKSAVANIILGPRPLPEQTMLNLYNKQRHCATSSKLKQEQAEA